MSEQAETSGGQQEEASTLEELLEQLCDAGQDDEGNVSIDRVMHAVGRRAFGPVLLIPGLTALSPISGIPGVPSAVGVMVLLTAGQLLVGRSEFWLPQFILRRSISRERFEKAISYVLPVARFVDRLVKPRLQILTGSVATYLIAALCLLMSLLAPALELVPFAITGVGAAVTAFGLALISDDGLLAMLAAVFCVGTATAAAFALL